MSDNIFGASGKSATTLGVNKKCVASKFITLTRNLQSKVNKAGDVMSRSLDIGANNITSSYVPKEEIDLTNKNDVDGKFLTKNYVRAYERLCR